MVRAIGLAILLISLASISLAAPKTVIVVCKTGPTATSRLCAIPVPEIDAASAIAGLTLLLGGVAVVRGRRTKNSQV